MKPRTSLLAGAVLVACSWPALACYTVLDANSRVIHRSNDAPVDMSRPLHETMPQRFPGGQLVFDLETSCPAAEPAAPVRAASQSPLLTDRRTAQALGVRYAPLAQGIVMVAPRDAAVAEAALGNEIMVIPSQPMLATTQRTPSTAAMGGPPARRR